MPASRGITRQARGGGGVTRRATPRGEMVTRRRARRAAAAAAQLGPITANPTPQTVAARDAYAQLLLQAASISADASTFGSGVEYVDG